MVLGNAAVVPHVAIAIDQSTDIVNFQLGRTLSALTGCGLGFDSSVLRVGILAPDILAGRYRRRKGNQQQGDQY